MSLTIIGNLGRRDGELMLMKQTSKLKRISFKATLTLSECSSPKLRLVNPTKFEFTTSKNVVSLTRLLNEFKAGKILKITISEET